MAATALRPREHDARIQSLRSGVTPRTGVRHFQVGRNAQVGAQERDLARIAEGGTSFRLIIGSGASGKTFFLNFVRGAAMEQQLVATHADLTPGCRLHAIPANATKIKPHHIPEINPEHG